MLNMVSSFDILKKVGMCATVALILLFSEVAYRHFFGTEVIQSWLEEYGILFLMCLIFVFARFKVTKVVVMLLFFLTTVCNNIHYHVYQGWLTGINLFLFFTEITEATNYGAAILLKLLPKILWGVLECLLVLSLSFLVKKKVTAMSDVVLLIALFLFSFRYTSPSHLEQGMSPQQIYGRAKIALIATGYCFGHEIPYSVFKLSMIPEYKNLSPVKKSQPLVKNIVLVMGESATSGHVGALGYCRKTTPFFDEVVKMRKGFVASCYSAATMTVVSLPYFFNCIYRPNAESQISSGETNLFKMAKEQGVYTYWVSAQARNQMAMMGSLGKRYLDCVRFPDSYGYGLEENISDSNLRKFLRGLNISEYGRNFVVLHQRGSHGPYGELLTKEEKSVYGEKTINDCYDNTIRMTDQLVKGVYEDLCNSQLSDWVLIYTSDHGQYVTGNVANQNTAKEDCYLVPLAIIPAPGLDIDDFIESELGGNKPISHYRVSCFIKTLLGYDSKNDRHDDIFVNRTQISGDAGFFYVKDGVTRFVTPDKYKNFCVEIKE